ncbi:MAG: hypothetical protein JXP48_00520 [Acidobacteria bacterium]|nr:hypothetical protein [Acidobacteriota bacterium]
MTKEAGEEGREAAPERIRALEEALRQLSGGSAECWTAPDCPEDLRQAHLEDMLAFENVGVGLSLFEGLEMHGLRLPRPETLNEKQSRKKVFEIMQALLGLQVMLAGFEHLSGRKLYRTLYEDTLWDGCYVKKKRPELVTIIDMSRPPRRSEQRLRMIAMAKAKTVQ